MLPLWLKAFHLIFMTCWFAGLFYLPRLFVYHALSEDKTSRDRFKIMEHKLYWGIMTPSALLTLTFGLGVMHSNLGYYSGLLWLKYKLALVLLLVCYHIYCGLCLRRFAQDNNTHSPVFYRVLNELPVFLLIGIVLLAILKPFSG